MSMRYDVTKSQVYQRDDGRTASIRGACPWTNETERARWTLVDRGWTIRDLRHGTIGNGQKPFATREEAQALVDRLNAR